MSIISPKKTVDVCTVDELHRIQDVANINRDYTESLEVLRNEALHIFANSPLIQKGEASAKATMLNTVELTTVANISVENGKPQISLEQNATMDRPRLTVEMYLK